MSKVLVDRGLLERIVNTNMADYAVIAYQHKEIRGILAQHAEAEGVAVVGYAVTWIRAGDTPEETVFMSTADFEATGGPRFYSYREPLILQSAHLAALSAVTAERDRLKHAPAQELLERLVAQLIESGAENYQESVFDLEVGSDVLTASVILRHLDKPGPHELRMQAEAERDRLSAEVEALRAFVMDCTETAGGMVNGNKLSHRAKEVIAAMSAKEA